MKNPAKITTYRPLVRATGDEGGPVGYGEPVVHRNHLEQQSNYQNYKENLRIDFWFSCSYCSVTELEASGFGFQIDHYIPESIDSSLKNDYRNLMYSCQRCNSAKSDTYPPEDARKDGWRFIKIDEEDPSYHFNLDGVRLEPKTLAGELTESVLELNSLYLRRVREIREKFCAAAEHITRGAAMFRKKDKIDLLPKNYRPEYLKLAQHFLNQIKSANKTLKPNLDKIDFDPSILVRSLALDINLEDKDYSKHRRAHLKEMKAVYPEPWTSRKK